MDSDSDYDESGPRAPVDEQASNNLMSGILDELNNDGEFANFLLNNLPDVQGNIQNYGNIVSGTADGPAMVLGFVPGTDTPVAQLNIRAAFKDLLHIHGNKLYESVEIFDNLVTSYFDKLYENARDIINHRGTDVMWQSDMENVHDNSVNKSLKNAYAKLVEANTKSDNCYKMANVRSYYFQHVNNINLEINRYQQAIVSADQLTKYANRGLKSDEQTEFMSQSKKIMEVLAYAKHRIGEIMINIRRISSVLMVLHHMETYNEFMVVVNDNEVNVLLEIWKRIHCAGNKDNVNHLLSIFTDQLLDLVNANKSENVECINGRISAMISSLEIYDFEKIVNIKCVPSLRVMIIQNRGPKLINEFLNKYDPETVKKYHESIEDDDTSLLRDKLILYVRENITDEFKNDLETFHIKKFINEIVEEL